jgi:Leucine-rich repeat (LRR) protein
MKLLIFIFVIIFLSFTESKKTLECVYQVSDFKLYTCLNTNLNCNTMDVIRKPKGNHLYGKSNNDVTSIYLLSSEMKGIPMNLFKKFPNLLRFVVHGLNIQDKFLNKESLFKGVFNGARKLTSVIITGTLLENLKENIFHGTENLNFLSLESNGISTIDTNAFNGLENLKSLSLNYNLIKSFNEGTFDNLQSLEFLSVSGNYIAEIEPKLLSSQFNLKTFALVSNVLEVIDSHFIPDPQEIYMEGNICIDDNFGIDDEKQISEFNHSAQNCTEPRRLKNLYKEVSKRLNKAHHFIGNTSIALMGSILDS